MANLIGSGINQLPTNGMLGNLAFQDKAYVSVDQIGIGTIFVDSGTLSQPLQVTGGAYVSGFVGIGTTNPTSALHVVGNTLVNGITTITGNFNAPGNYYVRVARTTNQTITTGTTTLIGFATITDPNSWYTGITTRTTPTVSGTYRIDGSANWQTGAITNNFTRIDLRKNGTTFAVSQVGISTVVLNTQNVTGIVTMNGTTDFIDVVVFTGNTTSQVLTGTSDGAWTKMELFKIN